MSEFHGFPARMQFTPVPNLFLNSLLPDITDITELKVTLHLFKVIYTKKGSIRYVSYGELLADRSLLDSIKVDEKLVEETLSNALSRAVERGTIINLTLGKEGLAESVYFLNTEVDKRIADKIKNGEMALSGLKTIAAPKGNISKPVEIFTLYEENIGMLTPMIAEELQQAEKLYPKIWIEEAIKEAVSLNKRNWRYIERILENWSREGRGDGTNRRDSKAAPDKFSQQKFGHMVQR